MVATDSLTRQEAPHRRGSPAYRRIALAMFSSGLATFTVLYAVQALLPALAGDFGLSPAQASLAVSVSTFGLAVGVIPLTSLSDAVGRTSLMTASMFVSAALAIAEVFSPSFEVLLVLRALQGLALAGLQATAMSYLSEELHRGSLGSAMGLYIAGNGFGGLSGRVLAGLIVDFAGWRVALGSVAVLSVACSVVFRLTILPSERFRPRPLRWRPLLASVARSCTDSGLIRLYAMAFLLMSCFVTVYNFLGFRLLAPDFGVPASVVGLLFMAYLAGSVSSTVSGRLADRHGRPKVLWFAPFIALAGLALMAPHNLVSVVAGLLVFTAGSLCAHSVASGWVGARSANLDVQGASVYLCCFYLGNSVGGSFLGLAFESAGWDGVTIFGGGLVLAVAVLAVSLRTLKPVGQPATER